MKNKKAQATNALIVGIIATIVGVAMIPVLASLIDDGQKLQVVTNEEITNTAFNTTFILANPKISVGTFTIQNSTCSTGDNCIGDPNETMRNGIEFELAERTSVLKIINKSGTWNVSYNFEPATFVETATGRTVVKQVTLMYAVGMIVLIMGAIGISVFKKE